MSGRQEGNEAKNVGWSKTENLVTKLWNLDFITGLDFTKWCHTEHFSSMLKDIPTRVSNAFVKYW